jgi:hypothetical protein
MYIVKAKHDDEEASKVGTDDNSFWPRLLQNKLLEKNHVNTDWDRYIDEDDEDEKGGFDMSALDGGMGMGGMGGMNDYGGLDDYGDMADMDSTDEEEDKDVDVKSNDGKDKDDQPDSITE